jgi:D-alanyl-D-alanine carboxypeptidase (penicillin-binding protein 5/6)
LKKKLRTIIPLFLLLALVTGYQYKSLKTYYDELEASAALEAEDFEAELKGENQRFAESEQEYRRMLEPSEEGEGDEPPVQVPKDIKLRAKAALLLDAENNRVLYEEHGYDKLPMASTTKIMTCIIALENADLNDIVTVSSYAARQPDVQLGLRTGEQYYLKDLLFSLMLESHNDSAVAIAEHVGGSVEGFATMMNDKARSLDCMNTNFVTANGLDAEGHYTTARDLAVIASYAIKNDLFIKITNTASHQFKELINGRGHSVSNKNKFLYMMDGAIGVKTGFTNKAGYCFVGALKRPDRTLVSVVLGSGWPPNKNLKWEDTRKLMTYGLEHYDKKQIFQEVKLEPLPVKDGQKKLEVLSLKGDLFLLMRKDEKVRVEYELPQTLTAPVESQAVVGYASYYINDSLYTRLPILTTEEIPRINYAFCLKKILRLWSTRY